MSFYSVLTIIMAIIGIIGTGVAAVIIKYWKFPELTGTKVFFEDTSDSKGSAISNLIYKKYVNGRLLLKCLPLDKPNPKTFMVAVEPNKVDVRPKGAWMSNSDAIRIYPNSVEDWFSNSFNHLENINAQSTIEKSQRIGIDRQRAHLLNMGEGETSRQDMALQEEFKNQQLSVPLKEDKTGKPGGYPSAHQGARDSFTS